MNNLLIKRKNKDNVIISVYHDEKSNKYRFINLTKKHICRCEFDSIEDAKEDLQKYIDNKEIIEINKVDALYFNFTEDMKNKKFKVIFNDDTYIDVAFIKDGEVYRLLNVKEGYLYKETFKEVQKLERQLKDYFGIDKVKTIENNKVFII